MTTPHTPAVVRQFDTLFSPLETTEQPAWLQRASAQERRQWQTHHTQGHAARRQAMQAFAPVQSLYTYNLLDLAPLDSATVTPDLFLEVQQRQQLDERYPTYLKAMLDDTELLSAKRDAYLATLREEYTLAQIKGHLSKDGKRLLDWIIEGFHDSSAEFAQTGPYFGSNTAICASLRLLGDLTLPGVVVLGADTDDAPCVVYMPGHPEHPLKEYSARTRFFADLAGALTSIEFQRYFLRFIPLRQQKRVLMHWLAEDAVLGAKMAVTPLPQGLRWFEQAQMAARLLDDARYLIPTTAQQAESLRDLSPVFVNAIEAHLMIGAGPGLCCSEEDEGQVPSEWLVPLRVIKPQPANYRRWLPDLSTYRLAEDSAANEQPDTQGLYRIGEHKAIAINQALYRVRQRSSGRWALVHPSDKDAYSPPLHHNGTGAWHHEHEHPEHWQRLSLLRRLGPAVAGLKDERLLQLARVSSTHNNDLRAVYLRDASMPALLLHVVQRAQLYDEVARTLELIRNGLPVPEVDNVPQLRAFHRAVAAYLGKEPAAQRVRRSDEPTPAPPDTPCEGSCNAPPADLYDEWAIRLNRAITLHRFELAQLTTDDAVQELQRRYPHMPLGVAQRLLDTNRARIQAPLLAVPTLPLALDLAEQARALDHDARLSHALEGFTQPALINQDSAILAVRLLEYLDNWPAGTALLLRGGERFGTPLAELGQTDVETTSIYLDDEEGWHAVSSTQVLLAQDMGEFGFYRALLHALGETLAARLGFGLNEPQRLHQQLTQMALARPTRARLLLGMPVQRSWLTNAAIVQHQRAPNRRDQNLFNREPLYTRLERLLTAHRLTLPRRQVNAYITHLLRENEPLGAHVTLLEQERLQLDGSLDRWVEQSPSALIRIQRADVARQLVHAWECRITQMPATVQVEYPQQDELPPLLVQLPAVAVLSVSRALPVDTLSTWLQQFPNLHQLELINLPLTELPQGLQQLRRLTTLNLSRTQLAPSALSTLANLVNLRTLVLNFIDLPVFHWRVRDMTRLLAGNTVRTLTILGAGASFDPGVFAELQSLTHLSLAQNRIRLSEQDVIDLGGLHRLVSLDLSANPLSRMPDLTALQALENLDLSYLNATLADWPVGLERLPQIQRANLRGLVITSVPVDAGRTRGLTMSSEHLPLSMREAFEEDVIASGNHLEDSDESSEQLSGSDSDSDASNEVNLSAAQFTAALQNAPGLFEGMSDDEQVQARQLLDDTGTSVREFFALLLRQDQLFPSGTQQAAMRLRLQALIRGAFSQSLRVELYEQARDAVSCVDRDAVVFSQMENLLEAYLALAKVDDSTAEDELVSMATSHWRALRLREHLSTQIRSWRQPGRRIDYSEIELYFRIALAKRLGLRNQPGEQVFTSYTLWVTQAMLDEACEAVLRSQAAQLPVYLYAQTYWQRHLDFLTTPHMTRINRWRARIGEYLDAVSSGELPPALNPDEQDRLRDILHLSGQLGLHEPLPAVLQLDSGPYRAAYDALQQSVEQARMELTRSIVNEPRPGPSSRS